MNTPIRTLPIVADTPPGGGAPGLRRSEDERERRPATDPTALHRLYLASLGGDGMTMEPAWAMALEASFGSVARWREALVAMGKALGGGAGWLMLCFQPHEGTLVHRWTTGHAPAGGVPILALDLGEHARQMDDGAAAAACVDDFIARIDWAGVYARYQAAVRAASEPFAAAQDEVAGRLLLDVRRAGIDARFLRGGIDAWKATGRPLADKPAA